MDPRLDLKKKIRPTLVRLEDSIILALFERAHYKTNGSIYVRGAVEIPGFDGSFFDWLFYKTESLYAEAGCYNDPNHHPFFKNLPEPVIHRGIADSPVKKTDINVNDKIKAIYIRALEKICEQGHDLHQHGSCVVWDIRALQALSKRIHYGIFVAEAKFQKDPETYRNLIQNQDWEGVVNELTDKDVEIEILERVREKGNRYHIDPQFIFEFYRDEIIPLTIEVELDYFKKRGLDD